MSRMLFALLMVLNVSALGLWFVLGLAAAKPSHTPVVSVVGFFMMPALLLGGVVLLFLRGPWAGSRALAIGLAGLPCSSSPQACCLHAVPHGAKACRPTTGDARTLSHNKPWRPPSPRAMR